MDRSLNSIMEFLGNVPLLQTLPSSSVRKIADLVRVREFDRGEYIVREGETGEGVYFIWDGEAGVSGSNNAEGGNYSENQMKQYDYFGYCSHDSGYQANVVALSKLICLVLRHESRNLLRPKSIWNSDGMTDEISLIEHILSLEPLEVNIFRGHSLPEAPLFRQVFGGQLIGQALAAATKTVDSLKLLHSFHNYFIVAGDDNLPILYEVCRLRDGNYFASRRVDAKQRGIVIFVLIASFQLQSIEELREKHLTDPQIPMYYKDLISGKDFVPYPIEIRFCKSIFSEEQMQPSLKYWFKVRGKLSDDPALHRCVVAYASDFVFGSVGMKAHLQSGLAMRSLSLDHAIWFHRPVKADGWLLYVIEGPSAYGGRSLSTGRIFNQKGELVMSLTQEALIRKVKQTKITQKPKL